MTTLRGAAQQALEALENTSPLGSSMESDKKFFAAITALRAALAEPMQEPVAWRTFDGEGGYDYRTYEDNEDYATEWAKRNPRHVGWVEPLYTAPRKPLTEEEIDSIWDSEKAFADIYAIARAIERAHGIGGQP